MRSFKRYQAALLLCASLAGIAAQVQAATVTPISQPTEALAKAPLSIGGRVVPNATGYAYQWPGVYFETAFQGTSLYARLGNGAVRMHVKVDGQYVTTLDKLPAGLYRIDGLTNGAHQVRFEVANENADGVKQFDGVWLGPGNTALTPPSRSRQIEVIGDSHTVGYGNTSPGQECTGDQVFNYTDNTQGFGATLARQYQADYRVHAISGRGVVRNYGGFSGATLPASYPFTLFNGTTGDQGTPWQPQVIAIALGTNDFSTPLQPGERWSSREALRADYVSSYVAFVRSLRARSPSARIILWTAAAAGSELYTEVNKVVGQLRAGGDQSIGFVPVSGLTFSSCHWHPSLADNGVIARALAADIDTSGVQWGGTTPTPTCTRAAVPARVEAEAYCHMSGIQTETTSDAGGGRNVGWTDAGDWMTYDVNVPAAGSYVVQYRVASALGGGVIQLERAGGGAVYGTVNVPNTGGWQTWTTVQHTVTLPAGPQTLAISARSGGFNLNWLDIASGGTPTPVGITLQAESFNAQLGVQTEATTDVGGGLNVGWLDAGDWLSYSAINLPAGGTYTVEYRVASLGGGGNLVLHEAGGGASYGALSIPSTGGWQNWTTVSHTVTLPAGSRRLAIGVGSGGWNLNWFRVTKTN